jgi:hypothetical protein
MKALLLRIIGFFLNLLISKRQPDPSNGIQKFSGNHTRRTVVQIHEAGHVVTAWYCTAVKEISVETDLPMGGITRVEVIGLQRSDVIWNQIVFKLGGVAAECLVFGKFNSASAEGDLLGALEYAEILVRRGQKASPAKTAGRVIPFEKIYVHTIGEAERDILLAAYVQARDLINARSLEFYRLVSFLIHHNRATESQMETVLGSRAAYRLLGTMGIVYPMPIRLPPKAPSDRATQLMLESDPIEIDTVSASEFKKRLKTLAGKRVPSKGEPPPF